MCFAASQSLSYGNQSFYQSITVYSKLVPLKTIAGHFADEMPWSGLLISSHIQN